MSNHADYPHTPGTLYDYGACESGCYCTEDYDCIFCYLEEGAETFGFKESEDDCS